MTFNNKVIWITGASSGIGKSLAIALSEYDCKLILSSRRQEELQKVKDACKSHENVSIVTLDLAKTTTLKSAVEEAVACFGRIDILVNNGGISQRSPIIETTIEVDRQLMEIDYLGTVALSKALLPYFVAQQSCHFVVVSSLM